MNTVERIETLRKEIEQKKINLGLNADILTIKTLKKYGNIASLSFPKSVENDYYYYRDKEGRFADIRYRDIQDVARLRHITDKITAEVKKKIFSDICILTENKSVEEGALILNNRINNHYGIDFLSIEVVPESEEKILDFVNQVYKKYEKTEARKVVMVKNHLADGISYCSYDVLMKGRGVGSFSNRTMKANVTDIMSKLAVIEVAKVVADYLFKSNSNYEAIVSKLHSRIDFNREELDNSIQAIFEDIIKGKIAPFDFIKAIIALTMESMLQEAFDIQEYETRLKELSGSYAKTYMTKKNIPKKIQSFMEDNSFLNMFDYVEADEQCDLDKLELLANEFMLLSNQMFLPKALNHSLRFRRLGKIKAAGVYYPGYNTLAVDIDSVSSFIHEFFHFIDFDNKILSLNNNFKPLLNLYRDLMEEAVNKLDKEDPIRVAWEGKNKYGSSYYRSNEEAFARMGELYVSEILGIKTNFNRVDYSDAHSQVVYPRNPELLALIQNYYSRLFMHLKESKKAVQF